MITFLATTKVNKDHHFWEIILPRTKSLLKSIDRYCPETLHDIIDGASAMRLQDNEFWEIIEEQMIDNKLHRYLNLDQVCSVVKSLGLVGRGSDELIETLEKYIIKHRKGLTTKNITQSREGFKQLDKGSAVLFEVLGDHSRGLKQINE